MKNLRSIWIGAAGAVLAATIAALAANTTFFTSLGDVVFPFTAPTSGAPGTIDNMTIGATTPRAVTGTTVTGTGAVSGASLAATGNITAGGKLLGPWGTYAINPASVATYASYTFANGQTLMSFTPGGTVSYIYVTMAPAPKDGDQACLFSTQTVTNLYLTASPGQTLVSAATALAANVRQCYTYSSGATSWTRTQ